MKRKLAVLLLAALLLTTCMAMFCGCVDEEPEPREVELGIMNPITGDVVKDRETLDLPTEKTPMEVYIKDKETGVFLEDSDLPENTIQKSCNLTIYFYSKEKVIDTWWSARVWPTNKDFEELQRSRTEYCRVRIQFDCKPSNLVDPKFERKYKITTDFVEFYINKVE